ncbi:CerR family C-terminal domain-containing protein [Stenotrophomonas sp. C3(2023)]|uniref:CerR family C-terminal domain-containing protein n=1 Tax=Stenotrophomonas sp. C3(2023) TaxID=3080277 RepID=UPI00293C9369|nr:CerR family C-terminal domain-containing protein [Stenotrophomonas sp. C3(2023)]MDV3468704.1 CerR family C-terminal domain-containing protein [Stenotrophomonas sp. C3(2023)]
MRHSDPNSVRADTLETRERLLGAAVKVFARHGFGGAGIRVISAEAGVNVALVGYHFGSKEGIYLEVVMQVCAMVNQRLAGAIETATQAAGCADGAAAVEAACALLDPLIDMVLEAETSDVARIMLHEQLDPGPGFDMFHQTLAAPFVELLGALIARARAVPFGDDERMSALAIMGMLLIFKSAQASSELLFGAQAWSARRRQILRQTIANAVHPTMGGAD